MFDPSTPPQKKKKNCGVKLQIYDCWLQKKGDEILSEFQVFVHFELENTGSEEIFSWRRILQCCCDQEPNYSHSTFRIQPRRNNMNSHQTSMFPVFAQSFQHPAGSRWFWIVLRAEHCAASTTWLQLCFIFQAVFFFFCSGVRRHPASCHLLSLTLNHGSVTPSRRIPGSQGWCRLSSSRPPVNATASVWRRGHHAV